MSGNVESKNGWRTTRGPAMTMVALGVPEAALALRWGEEEWGVGIWAAGPPIPAVDALQGALLLAALVVAAGWMLRKVHVTRPTPSELRRHTQRLGGALLCALWVAGPEASRADQIAVPFTFVNGTIADATEMNANFDALVLESNAQDLRIADLEATATDGTVTSVLTGSGLTGGPITTSGTISVQTGGILAVHLGLDAVTAAAIAPGAVGASEIADGAVGAAEIGPDAVGASEIATDAVGSPEIAANAVGASEIGTGAVGSSEIAGGAVGSAQIAAGAVGSNEIASGVVTTPKLADDAVDAAKLFLYEIVDTFTLASNTSQEFILDCNDPGLTSNNGIAISGGWRQLGAPGPRQRDISAWNHGPSQLFSSSAWSFGMWNPSGVAQNIEFHVFCVGTS